MTTRNLLMRESLGDGEEDGVSEGIRSFFHSGKHPQQIAYCPSIWWSDIAPALLEIFSCTLCDDTGKRGQSPVLSTNRIVRDVSNIIAPQ